MYKNSTFWICAIILEIILGFLMALVISVYIPNRSALGKILIIFVACVIGVSSKFFLKQHDKYLTKKEINGDFRSMLVFFIIALIFVLMLLFYAVWWMIFHRYPGD